MGMLLQLADCTEPLPAPLLELDIPPADTPEEDVEAASTLAQLAPIHTTMAQRSTNLSDEALLQ